ncbi:uncharacterized protein A4U43_C01F35860 [Asparagus officinalis]|uniref:WEB family protein n=1 Tax=Asparagus officinalis TaxID=4686 RepID=A0A5P1FUQ1_ASPOF|nr:WEB family protein At5g55860-like [Asparagus officinalis]ONK82075.1 uncharacterized protein A4U43_C01F35860 [Asparagus officinalis]
MGVKGRSFSFDSVRGEVGEIDTRAPFSSVKAAASLFGEVAFTGKKGKPYSPVRSPITPDQTAFVTETQFHLAQKELSKFKEQLQNSETTKAQALAELENAKKTVQDLTAKLTAINESKKLALNAAEAANTRTNPLNEEASSADDQTGKLELARSREKYAAAILELDAAKQELKRIKEEFEASAEAKISALNQESQANQQSEANALKASQLSKEISAAKETLDRTKKEESKIQSEKDSLESKLVEAETEITAVHEKLEDAVTNELDEAKEVLQKVEGEESSLRSLVESLKLELETVTKQHNNLKKKDAETEALVADLNIKLEKCKAELEAATESETEAMNKEVEAARIEAEAAKLALLESEKKLEIAVKDAEAAKAAEARALDEIKNLSAKAEIVISKEEFQSLNKKAEGSGGPTEMKATAAEAQVDPMNAIDTEAEKRLEATKKEIEETELAKQDALKRAEMAGSSKNALEGEVKRLNEKEQKKATETEGGSPPRVSSPSKVSVDESEGSKKKGSSRKSLLTNLSGIFHKKKSTVDGSSPSHASGDKEKHVR